MGGAVGWTLLLHSCLHLSSYQTFLEGGGSSAVMRCIFLIFENSGSPPDISEVKGSLLGDASCWRYQLLEELNMGQTGEPCCSVNITGNVRAARSGLSARTEPRFHFLAPMIKISGCLALLCLIGKNPCLRMIRFWAGSDSSHPRNHGLLLMTEPEEQ